MILHPFEPFYREDSHILILGSFPSVKSREEKFFYGHPKNRFWKVLSNVFSCETPVSIAEKKAFLAAHNIALWDVLAACEIHASEDSSIKNAVVNDLTPILQAAPIQTVFVNGKTAHRYFARYLQPKLQREAVYLPSTSPANAAWSLERLVQAWSIIKESF